VVKSLVRKIIRKLDFVTEESFLVLTVFLTDYMKVKRTDFQHLNN